MQDLVFILHLYNLKLTGGSILIEQWSMQPETWSGN